MVVIIYSHSITDRKAEESRSSLVIYVLGPIWDIWDFVPKTKQKLQLKTGLIFFVCVCSCVRWGYIHIHVCTWDASVCLLRPEAEVGLSSSIISTLSTSFFQNSMQIIHSVNLPPNSSSPVVPLSYNSPHPFYVHGYKSIWWCIGSLLGLCPWRKVHLPSLEALNH